MDTQQIQELTELFEKKGLSKMEICEGDTKILFEKEVVHEVASVANATSAAIGTPDAAPGPPVASTPTLTAGGTENLTEVKSPMVGVFYAASSPDSAPFATVGTKVRKGDILCIVEAMKLMNEIVAEVDGEVAEVCVENGQVVEFSQTLFKIF